MADIMISPDPNADESDVLRFRDVFIKDTSALAGLMLEERFDMSDMMPVNMEDCIAMKHTTDNVVKLYFHPEYPDSRVDSLIRDCLLDAATLIIMDICNCGANEHYIRTSEEIPGIMVKMRYMMIEVSGRSFLYGDL